jgi:glucose-1-phosphate adenylyltransferase
MIYFCYCCIGVYLDNVAFQALQSPIFAGQEVNPKTVASIILGGGAGTRLFPLTQNRAKPAVKY